MAKRYMTMGIMGCLLAFVSAALISGITLPWLKSSDEPLHLDYAWQVSQGRLPKFNKGPQMPIKRSLPNVQWVSQHPPLYYLYIAPFVSRLIKKGDWRSATAASRLATVLIGAANVLMLAWAGWVLARKRRYIWAVALPAIASSLTLFVRLSALTYNDALAILFATWGLGLCALVIRNGMGRRYLVLLSLAAVLGMATRASFISVLGLIFLSVAVAVWLHGQGSLRSRCILITKYCGVIGVVVLLGIGWFYWRNYEVSGSWARSAPQEWANKLINRRAKSYAEVLTRSDYWLKPVQNLYDKPWQGMSKAVSDWWPSVIVFVSMSALGGLTTIRRRIWRELKTSDGWIVFIMLLQMVLLYGQQLVHAVPYGAINMRYFLPGLLPIGLLLTYGALFTDKMRGVLVVVIAAIGWAALLSSAASYVTTRSPIKTPDLWYNIVNTVTEVNKLPFGMIPVLLIGLIVGLVLQTRALWVLTQYDAENSSVASYSQ